jgi:hypothetical protein
MLTPDELSSGVICIIGSVPFWSFHFRDVFMHQTQFNPISDIESKFLKIVTVEPEYRMRLGEINLLLKRVVLHQEHASLITLYSDDFIFYG